MADGTASGSRPWGRHLADLVEERAARDGKRPALVAGDVRLSYGELAEAVVETAGGFAQIGLCRGETLGLLCTNRAEWVVAALAAFRLGARVAAFNTFAQAWDLAYMLEHSRAGVLVVLDTFRARNYLETLAEIAPQLLTDGHGGQRLPDLRRLVIVGDGDGHAGALTIAGLRAAGAAGAPAGSVGHRSAVDDSFILYTSGSSARPKAVALQHYAQIENGFEIGRRVGLSAEDRVWISVPLFWAYGALNALSATLTHGACAVLQETFEAGEALDLIERERCTAAYLLPNITSALVRHDAFAPERTATLRRGLTLGAESDLRTTAEVLGVAHICNIYGSTETYGNCCVTPWDWPLEEKLLSQGPPLPGVELRVVDPEARTPLATGEQGEIEVRGYIARGYLDAPGDANDVFAPDGWYRTGDLGQLDERGCLRFGARATEMIKTGGINVAPSEVEEFLRLCADVRDAAVVGVPDDDSGEVVVAFVVPADGALVTEDDVLEHCRGMARYKHPARVHVVGALPKTSTGKLARRALIDLDGSAAGEAAR